MTFKKDMMTVLTENPSYIQYIPNPTNEEIFLAVTINPSLVKYVLNPSSFLLKYVIMLNPSVVNEIQYLSYDIQKFIIDLDVSYVKYITNLHPKIEIEALHRRPDCIKLIYSPSFTGKRYIVMNYPKYIHHIESLDFVFEKMLLTKDLSFFQKFKNPSLKAIKFYVKRNNGHLDRYVFINEKEQEDFLSKNPALVKWILNPCDNVRNAQILDGFCSIDGLTELSSGNILAQYVYKKISLIFK